MIAVSSLQIPTSKMYYMTAMVKGAAQCQLLQEIRRDYEQRGLGPRPHLARYRHLEVLILKSISSPTASSSTDSSAARFSFEEVATT